MTEPTNTGVTITVKGGKEFLDPWIVIHASDIADAAAQLGQLDPTTSDALAAFDLGLAVAQAGVNFQAKVALAKGGVAAPAPAPAPEPEPPAQAQGWGAAPQTQPQAPAQPAPQQWSAAPQQAAPQSYSPPQRGPAPMGTDGYEMVWKSGIGKTGKPWKAWMSGAPRDFAGTKAEAQFIR